MKQPYVKLDFEKRNLTFTNPICSSVEYYKEYIASEPGDWEDPTFDPDDEIIW